MSLFHLTKQLNRINLPSMKFISTLFIFFLCLNGCTNEEPEQKLTLPSNLVALVDVSQDGSGEVTVTAEADNTNFYTIFFGEDPAEKGVKTSDGKASYTYKASGNFTVRAQAHVTQAEFVSKSNIFVFG